MPSPPRALRSEQILLFGRNFLKHPKMLGSLIPSSRFLVNHVLSQVDWNRARVFLEYGPGVGTFTTEILRRMRPDAVLVVLETNTDFVRFLRAKLQDDRLHVVHGSAADADAVLARLELEPRGLRDLGHSLYHDAARAAGIDSPHHPRGARSQRRVSGLSVYPGRAAAPAAGLRLRVSGL